MAQKIIDTASSTAKEPEFQRLLDERLGQEPKLRSLMALAESWFTYALQIQTAATQAAFTEDPKARRLMIEELISQVPATPNAENVQPHRGEALLVFVVLQSELSKIHAALRATASAKEHPLDLIRARSPLVAKLIKNSRSPSRKRVLDLLTGRVEPHANPFRKHSPAHLAAAELVAPEVGLSASTFLRRVVDAANPIVRKRRHRSP